ncbi:MAG: hypothetical protein ACYC7E_22615 [Armatimonadota bacterium]
MRFHVSRQQHLRHAAIVWVVVGLLLSARGLHYMATDLRFQGVFPYLLPVAILLGVLKGAAVLNKTAARAVARIRELADRTPVWQLYSPAMYLLIVGMILLGIAMRWAGAYWHLAGTVGAIYLVIGIALVIGSRAYWQARIEETPREGEAPSEPCSHQKDPSLLLPWPPKL